MAGPQAGGLSFRLPLRRPFRLGGESIGAQLLRHGWFVTPPEYFVASLYQRLLTENPAAIHADTLHVETPAGPRALPVDMRNSQFIGADLACFPDGHEPDVLAAIDLLLPDDGVFLDAGANWGCFALGAALRSGFHGQVIAIEPAPRAADDCARLARALGLQLRLLRVALGAEDGLAMLSAPIMSGGASLLDGAGHTSVPLRRLDGLGLPPLNVIKLDVEGAETDALRGASHTLAHRPSIIMECRTDTPGGDWRGPLELLLAAGLRLFSLAATVTDGTVVLGATPMRPEDRPGLPLHLNVLALAPDTWEALASHPARSG